jgi:hypothetical protein
MPPERAPSGLGRLGAFVVGLHGVIHVVGFLLLWELAEVGEFTYDMATPDAGTTAGRIVGAAWLVAAVLFVATAIEVWRGSDRWRKAALAGCIVSTPALLVDAGDAFAGLVVNLAIVAIVLDVPDRIRAIAGDRPTA